MLQALAYPLNGESKTLEVLAYPLNGNSTENVRMDEKAARKKLTSV